jgi:uncharacterized protein YecE (DUF72 family)
MPIKIGCAVWAYPGWMGEVYPPKTNPTDFLHFYSRHFSAVEGNSTFYAVPDEEILARWCAQTPADFKFCLKFPRSITHQGALVPQISNAIDFIDRVKILGDKLGIIFIQLPPNYPSDRFSDLAEFLTALPGRDFQIALEVRHQDWFRGDPRDRLRELLHRLGIGRVILDTRPIYQADLQFGERVVCKKPHMPIDLELTAPFTLIRYVSHPIAAANQTWLTEWCEPLRAWLDLSIQIYTCVHCPIEARSPINARYLHQIWSQAGIDIAPLPPRPIDLLPQQLSFF